MKFYKVGGCVRDEILGVQSKDVDFTVVLDKDERYGFEYHRANHTDPFKYMVAELENQGFKIFLKTPEFLTVRAQFPPTQSAVIGNSPSPLRLTADFVLARKESGYADGRRPDTVEAGTLMDDLSRRDFTMNAIAQDEDGTLIDPFNGADDINARIIRAVGDPFDRLTEDALRAVRALRFSVTKGFSIDRSLIFAMENAAVLDSIQNKISDERIRDELSKMFRFDSVSSVRMLGAFPLLTKAMFSGSVSLDATMKTKGRG